MPPIFLRPAIWKNQKVKYTLLTVNTSWDIIENKTLSLLVLFGCSVPVYCHLWIPWPAQVFCKHRWGSEPFLLLVGPQNLARIYSVVSFFQWHLGKNLASSWLHFLLTEGVLEIVATFDADDARQCLEAQLQQTFCKRISWRRKLIGLNYVFTLYLCLILEM